MPKKPKKKEMDFGCRENHPTIHTHACDDVGNGHQRHKAHKAEKASMMPLAAAKALMQWMIDTQTFWAAWTNATDWYGENDITKPQMHWDAMKDLRPLTMDAKELKDTNQNGRPRIKLADLLAEKAALDQL